MNWRTCASWRASFITLRSSSLTYRSTALRASSIGLITAISSGRPSINSSARKDIGTADHQAEVFEKAANMVLEVALDLN